MRDHLDRGEYFLAQDLAISALQKDQDNDDLRALVALALVRANALDQAQEIIAPLLAGLADKAINLHTPSPTFRLPLERLQTLADVCYQFWRQGDDQQYLGLAQDLHDQVFAQSQRTRSGTLALILAYINEQQNGAVNESSELIRRLAAQVADKELSPDAGEREAFWHLAAQAVLLIFERKPERAVKKLKAAHGVTRLNSSKGTQLRRVLAQLQRASDLIPEGLLEALPAPGLLVFSGLAFDPPGSAEARLPLSKEAAIRQALDEELASLEASIGYCSLTCGSELIFAEALLARGGELNLVLPFNEQDFLQQHYQAFPRSWTRRFHRVVEAAKTVDYANRGTYLGDGNGYRFANQILHGLATLRSRAYDTAPYLVTLWDLSPDSLVGDAADFIDQWADITRLRVLDPDFLPDVESQVTPQDDRTESPQGEETETDQEGTADLAPTASALSASGSQSVGTLEEAGLSREIRTLLFADFVNFRAVSEDCIPAYLAFLARLSDDLKALPKPPLLLNTWGDAIFAVAEQASDLATFALQLRKSVLDHATPEKGFPKALAVRISLNAGPVFAARDPLLDKANFFGAEVVTTARLEPVTVPNQIYATKNFVSVLLSEESAEQSRAQALGQAWASPFDFTYVGQVALAKDAGNEAIYHLTGRTRL
ncbi:adenylate/guanylate cyclase domain-containing protein [Rhodovibrionaceae bacterium A322]